MGESVLQLIIKGLPESFLSVLMIYFISQTKLEKKKYFLITIIYFTSTFFIRMLPIVAGVNTIIGFSLLLVLMITVSDARPSKTILATILTILSIIICEFLNLLFVFLMYGEEIANALSDPKTHYGPLQKALFTMPSTFFFGFFVLGSYFIMKFFTQRALLKKDIDGKVSE